MNITKENTGHITIDVESAPDDGASEESYCYICHVATDDKSPCSCKTAFVHQSCLAELGKEKCTICGDKVDIKKVADNQYVITMPTPPGPMPPVYVEMETEDSDSHSHTSLGDKILTKFPWLRAIYYMTLIFVVFAVLFILAGYIGKLFMLVFYHHVDQKWYPDAEHFISSCIVFMIICVTCGFFQCARQSHRLSGPHYVGRSARRRRSHRSSYH
jgi:hypothetical protein